MLRFEYFATLSASQASEAPSKDQNKVFKGKQKEFLFRPSEPIEYEQSDIRYTTFDRILFCFFKIATLKKFSTF